MENDLAHLRTVSRTGQSQAVSIWAWPTATTAFLDVERASRTGANAARAAGRATHIIGINEVDGLVDGPKDG